jgi:uncharacterized protein
MTTKDEIWILADDKPGTFSQSIGLAKELGFEYKIIKLTYSFFAKLPNHFPISAFLRITPDLRSSFKSTKYFPKIIISAGRRSAPLALRLKKLSKNQTQVIQIMNPDMGFDKFDFVILPKHDEIDEGNFNNVITSIGSITNVDQNLIAAEKEKFYSWFGEMNKTKIAVLVGGSSNKTKFCESCAKNLANQISKIANKMDAKLLILNSRRTSEEITKTLKTNLDCDFQFFDWQETKNENPYLAILGYADFFIITGDSVSMISECCSSGKPVYIFDEKEISAKKHRKFHQNLFANHYAKKLTKSTLILEDFAQKKLQETKRIAAIIRTKF